jgi:adenylosuccinate synthase
MKAVIVAGLGFGDEGKGGCVDFLVRDTGAKLVVRYNGGPQCSHNVVTSDGRHHTFAQFSSGSFVPGVRTYLSRYMLIEPFALMNEWNELKKKIEPILLSKLLSIESSAPVITPFHWILNRLKESKRGKRHGSCGMGVGELRRDQLYSTLPILQAKDLLSKPLTMSKLSLIQQAKIRDAIAVAGEEGHRLMEQEDIAHLAEFYREFACKVPIVPDGSLESLSEGKPVVFEGAQGVLIDEKYGFPPHNTWTDTTFANAVSLCSPYDSITRIGVLRTYATRHGAGPFPSENSDVNYPDHNKTGEWQGAFRQGYFDIPAARYAIKAMNNCGGVDGIALTCCDRTGDSITAVAEYADDMRLLCEQNTAKLFESVPGAVIEGDRSLITDWLKVPVVIESFGPTAEDKVKITADIACA